MRQLRCRRCMACWKPKNGRPCAVPETCCPAGWPRLSVRLLVAESWFALSRADQAEALEVAALATGRPPHLLEKDIWEMVPDALRDSHPIPASSRQAKKIIHQLLKASRRRKWKGVRCVFGQHYPAESDLHVGHRSPSNRPHSPMPWKAEKHRPDRSSSCHPGAVAN